MNEEKRNYCVYKHTSPSNKIYIGITKNIKNRWSRKGHGYKNNPYFINAINKYGWDNFKHEILFDKLTKNEACELEKTLIKEYNSTDRSIGYNISLGGEAFFEGCTHTKETKEKLSKVLKGKNKGENSYWYGKSTPTKGIKYSKEHNKKLSKILKEKYSQEGIPQKKLNYIRNNSRKINQYDLQGNLIKTWDCFKDIKESLFPNATDSCIYNCCIRKNIKSYYGFQWRYADDCDDIQPYSRYDENSYDSRKESVCEISLIDGSIIKIYESSKQAYEELGFKISASIVNRQPLVHGRLFIKLSEYDNKKYVNQRLEQAKHLHKGSSMVIEEIDKDGNVLGRYNSIKEASDILGISHYGIGEVCKGKNKTTAHGRMFRYSTY